MNNPSYLGDGAYVHIDGIGRMTLTTGHHDPAQADFVIVLEPEVLDAFQKYVAKRKAALAAEVGGTEP